jgi:hypothetical protein
MFDKKDYPHKDFSLEKSKFEALKGTKAKQGLSKRDLAHWGWTPLAI